MLDLYPVTAVIDLPLRGDTCIEAIMELTGGGPKLGSKEGRNAKSSKVQVWLLVENTFLSHLSRLPSEYTFPSRPDLLNGHSE